MLAILWIVLVTFIPTLELRASIPWGILIEERDPLLVFVVAVTANFLLGLALYPLMDVIMKVMQKIPFVHRIWSKYVERTRRKIHAGVEKYGEWAVGVFIGIPLPGTGVYSGALAAYLIGLPFKKFIIADLIGVLIAGVLVTFFCLTGNEFFLWLFTKPVQG